RHHRRPVGGRGGRQVLRRGRAGLIILRARVEAHRLVDEVVDRAVEVVGHLLERLPKDVPAVEMAHRLLALVHRSSRSSSAEPSSMKFVFFSRLTAWPAGPSQPPWPPTPRSRRPKTPSALYHLS